MTLGELRTAFREQLARDDCSVSLADRFIGQGLQRIQREVRAPFMERLQVFNEATTLSIIPVPTDFLEMIDILVDGLNGHEGLLQVPYRQLFRTPISAPPAVYARQQAQWHLRGHVGAGIEVLVSYYGGLSPLADDAAENEATAAAPDLCLYAALAYAGDHFGIKRAESWGQTYLNIRDGITEMAAVVDSSGGPMQVQAAY